MTSALFDWQVGPTSTVTVLTSHYVWRPGYGTSPLFMASNEAINSRDVRHMPARHSHRLQRPKRSHDKCRYESIKEGFGGRRREHSSRKKYTRDWSSNGPPLFLIYWPDIKLGGPYGPVKDKMYWLELVRTSEKCARPVGQCLCQGLLRQDSL